MKRALITVLVFIGLATICIAKAHATERQEYIGKNHLLVRYLSPTKQIARGLRGVSFNKEAAVLRFKDERSMYFSDEVRYISFYTVDHGDVLILKSYNKDDTHDTAVIYDGKIVTLEAGVRGNFSVMNMVVDARTNER